MSIDICDGCGEHVDTDYHDLYRIGWAIVRNFKRWSFKFIPMNENYIAKCCDSCWEKNDATI